VAWIRLRRLRGSRSTRRRRTTSCRRRSSSRASGTEAGGIWGWPCCEIHAAASSREKGRVGVRRSHGCGGAMATTPSPLVAGEAAAQIRWRHLEVLHPAPLSTMTPQPPPPQQWSSRPDQELRRHRIELSVKLEYSRVAAASLSPRHARARDRDKAGGCCHGAAPSRSPSWVPCSALPRFPPLLFSAPARFPPPAGGNYVGRCATACARLLEALLFCVCPASGSCAQNWCMQMRIRILCRRPSNSYSLHPKMSVLVSVSQVCPNL
jgi:hypothetical protein